MKFWESPNHRDVAPQGQRRLYHQLRAIKGLSERQTQAFMLMLSGLSNKEIAAKMFISTKTLKGHLTLAYQRLDSSGRTHSKYVWGHYLTEEK